MKKDAGAWIKATRPGTVFNALLFFVITQYVANAHKDVVLLIATGAFITVGGWATMFFNDYVDRHHDALKCKTFALENERKFLTISIILWVMAAILMLVIFWLDNAWGLISLVLLVLGFSYSLSFRIQGGPAVYVALTSTGPLWYAVYENPGPELVLFAVSSFLFVWGRENLKDLDDIEHDEGYKPTNAVKIGREKTQRHAAIAYALATFPMLPIVISVGVVPTFVVVMFVAFILYMMVRATYSLFTKENHLQAKKIGDNAMKGVLLYFIIVFLVSAVS